MLPIQDRKADTPPFPCCCVRCVRSSSIVAYFLGSLGCLLLHIVSRHCRCLTLRQPGCPLIVILGTGWADLYTPIVALAAVCGRDIARGTTYTSDDNRATSCHTVELRRVTSSGACRGQLAICTDKRHVQIHGVGVKQRDAELTVDRTAAQSSSEPLSSCAIESKADRMTNQTQHNAL